jgi:hypothetical protein
VRTFFPDRFLSTVFFLRTAPLDFSQDGRLRGNGHVDFASKDGSLAAKTSAAQNPICIGDRKLHIEYSLGSNRKPVTKPFDKLYYSGCSGDVSKIMTIFQQFNESILEVSLCMLFTLSNSVPTTHTELH